jgi:hypothetical protein
VSGHVFVHHYRSDQKRTTDGLKTLSSPKEWRIVQTFARVAGVAHAAGEPWFAEASQHHGPRKHHLLEDNPCSG